jgi:hypothetical protein
MKEQKNGIKYFLKISFFSFCILLMALSGRAQTIYDTARIEMLKINSKYDSAFYLTFDIKIIYDSDTLWAGTDSADHTHTEMTGTYTFHGNKALYRLGDIEYMQNDAFTIAVYNNDKIMLVGKPDSAQRPGLFIPTRSVIDTMLRDIAQQYNCIFNQYDSLKHFCFNATDTNNVYESIDVEYDPVTYYLLKVKYRLKDYEYYDDNGNAGPNPTAVVRKADMIFLFQNYRAEQVGAAVFSETKYLFFDGPDSMKPANAYKEYVIYKNQ